MSLSQLIFNDRVCESESQCMARRLELTSLPQILTIASNVLLRPSVTTQLTDARLRRLPPDRRNVSRDLACLEIHRATDAHFQPRGLTDQLSARAGCRRLWAMARSCRYESVFPGAFLVSLGPASRLACRFNDLFTCIALQPRRSMGL